MGNAFVEEECSQCAYVVINSLPYIASAAITLLVLQQCIYNCNMSGEGLCYTSLQPKNGVTHAYVVRYNCNMSGEGLCYTSLQSKNGVTHAYIVCIKLALFKL